MWHSSSPSSPSSTFPSSGPYCSCIATPPCARPAAPTPGALPRTDHGCRLARRGRYFIALFVLTMKRQIKHMIKYKYVPFSFGKARYKGDRRRDAQCSTPRAHARSSHSRAPLCTQARTTKRAPSQRSRAALGRRRTGLPPVSHARAMRQQRRLRRAALRRGFVPASAGVSGSL